MTRAVRLRVRRSSRAARMEYSQSPHLELYPVPLRIDDRLILCFHANINQEGYVLPLLLLAKEELLALPHHLENGLGARQE